MYGKYGLCIGCNKLKIQWNISEARAVMAVPMARVNYSILHCDLNSNKNVIDLSVQFTALGTIVMGLLLPMSKIKRSHHFQV